MRSIHHRIRQSPPSTRQCKEMIMSNCATIMHNQFASDQQEEIEEKFQQAIREDRARKDQIKDKLCKEFFFLRKKRNVKSEMRKKFSNHQTIDNDRQVRRKLERKMKDSLSLVYKNRSCTSRNSESTPRRSSFTREVEGNSSPFDHSFCRPFTSPLKGNIEHTPSKKEFFRSKIDNIIEESHKVSNYQNGLSQKSKSARRQETDQQKDKREQLMIMDKVIEKDINDLMSNSKNEKFNPEFQREKQEKLKMKRLSNFEKYNMSFNKFIKHKTITNIQRSIYNDKIRHKDNYVEKFQKKILDQFKFSDQARLKLEKVFEGIENEYKGNLKMNKEKAKRSTIK